MEEKLKERILAALNDYQDELYKRQIEESVLQQFDKRNATLTKLMEVGQLISELER